MFVSVFSDVLIAKQYQVLTSLADLFLEGRADELGGLTGGRIEDRRRFDAGSTDSEEAED